MNFRGMEEVMGRVRDLQEGVDRVRSDSNRDPDPSGENVKGLRVMLLLPLTVHLQYY